MSLVRTNRVVRGPWHSRCSFDAQEDDGESFHVTIVESASVTIRTRNLEVLLYSKTDTPIGHDDVATLVKMKGSRKGFLRAEYRDLCAEEVCYVELEVQVGACKVKPFSWARVDGGLQTHQLP
jgi:hypothetical protein